MKIAIASLYLPSGTKIGVGYQVEGLANALVKRGHEVVVFSQTGASEGTRFGVQVVKPRQWGRTFGFAWDLRKEDFSGFDVLNAHGDDWFLWGRKRPRHVHTYHGSCFAEMLNVMGAKEKLRMGMLAACEYSSLMLADETVTVSENTRRYIPGIRHVIPCGVDTGAFRPGTGKSAVPAVLFVGTMHGRKRGRMLVETFRKEVRPRVKGAEMWCVCERPADMAEEDGVKFMGRLSQERLVDLFQRAWAFCLPSTYEGFGVPYVEAMAAGLPVVATGNVEAREVMREGRDGVIVDEARLGEALVSMLTDAVEREKYAEAGLRRASAFNWDRVCELYEAIYRGEDADVKGIETEGTA